MRISFSENPNLIHMHPHCNLVQIAFALSNQRMDTKIERFVVIVFLVLFMHSHKNHISIVVRPPWLKSFANKKSQITE